MIYHLLAHNQKNLVKEGDKVEKYKTPVATIGKGYRNEYPAHLHYSVSEGLEFDVLRKYVNGWSKDQVQRFYMKPTVDLKKMFGKKMNLTNGWKWLQWYGAGYHPAIDINDPKGGDSDLGLEFKAPCDGEVVLESNWGKDWGKVVIIEEKGDKTMDEASCEVFKTKIEVLNSDITAIENSLKEKEKEVKALRETVRKKDLAIDKMIEDQKIDKTPEGKKDLKALAWGTAEGLILFQALRWFGVTEADIAVFLPVAIPLIERIGKRINKALNK